MRHDRTNKILTGIITVTLVTSQVPAAALAEEADELRALAAQTESAAEAAPAEEGEPAAEEPAEGDAATSADSAAGEGEAPAQGEQQDPAAEPATSEAPTASEGPAPSASAGADASGASVEEPAAETPAADEAQVAAASDALVDEQQAEAGLPVALSGQELRYHKGDLTKKDLYAFLTANFVGYTLFTLTHVNADGSDGDKLENINALYLLSDDRVSLADGTYRVQRGNGSLLRPTCRTAAPLPSRAR